MDGLKRGRGNSFQRVLGEQAHWVGAAADQFRKNAKSVGLQAKAI